MRNPSRDKENILIKANTGIITLFIQFSKCSDVSFDDDFHRAIHQVNPEFLVVKKTIELNQSINKSNTKSENAYSLDENYPNYIVN